MLDFYKEDYMKRILVITSSMCMGGVEKSMLRLLKQINYEKYEVTLLLVKKEGELYDDIPKDVKIIEMAFENESYRQEALSLSEKSWFHRVLLSIDYSTFHRKLQIPSKCVRNVLKHVFPLKEEYDLAIDFHGYGHFGIPFMTEKVNAKVKVEFIHDENISGYYKVARYLRKIDYYFAVSEACRQVFSKEYSNLKDRICVFENIIDVETIRKLGKEINAEEINKNEGEITFVSVGRLEEQKGFDRGVEAFSQLKAEGYKFAWYIIGEGSQKDNLEKEIMKKKLEDSIWLLGSRSNPFPYMMQADVLLQPSRHEGKPLTVFESQILGIPALVTQYSAAEEQILHDVNGYIVENTNEGIYDGLKFVLNNTERITKWKKELEKITFSNEKSMEMIYSLMGDKT